MQMLRNLPRTANCRASQSCMLERPTSRSLGSEGQPSVDKLSITWQRGNTFRTPVGRVKNSVCLHPTTALGAQGRPSVVACQIGCERAVEHLVFSLCECRMA